MACSVTGNKFDLICGFYRIDTTPFKVFSRSARYTEARYPAGNGYLLQTAHLRVIEPPER